MLNRELSPSAQPLYLEPLEDKNGRERVNSALALVLWTLNLLCILSDGREIALKTTSGLKGFILPYDGAFAFWIIIYLIELSSILSQMYPSKLRRRECFSLNIILPWAIHQSLIACFPVIVAQRSETGTLLLLSLMWINMLYPFCWLEQNRAKISCGSHPLSINDYWIVAFFVQPLAGWLTCLTIWTGITILSNLCGNCMSVHLCNNLVLHTLFTIIVVTGSLSRQQPLFQIPVIWSLASLTYRIAAFQPNDCWDSLDKNVRYSVLSYSLVCTISSILALSLNIGTDTPRRSMKATYILSAWMATQPGRSFSKKSEEQPRIMALEESIEKLTAFLLRNREHLEPLGFIYVDMDKNSSSNIATAGFNDVESSNNSYSAAAYFAKLQVENWYQEASAAQADQLADLREAMPLDKRLEFDRLASGRYEMEQSHFTSILNVRLLYVK